MSIRRAVLALGFAGALLVPATAANAAPSNQDATYLKAAHQSNLAEIAGGQIAQQKGNSQQVKDLGARFVADHTKLDTAVKSAASKLGVDLPSAPNAQQQAVAKRYQAASGKSFDSLYVSTQMDGHMAAMANGEKEISNGSDATAKQNAQDAAPVIASHHDALNAAARDLGVPSRIGTGTGGLAAHHTFTTQVVGLITIGAMLLVVGAVALFRRRRVLA